MRASVLIGLVLALTGAGARHALAEDTIKVAVGARGLGETFVPELGQTAGIFKKHGLSLDYFYTQGGGETQQAVIANSAQIGVGSGLSGAMGAFAKGAPLRVIGATYTGGKQLYWYVKADSPVKSLKDTANMTVAFSTVGSSTHTAILALQKLNGATFKPTATGSAPATLTQVLTGQIDVGWAGAPFGVDAVDQGKIRVIAKASDDPVLDRQTIRVSIINTDAAANMPDLAQRFMRGYRETLTWVYDTPDGLAAYAKWSNISPAVGKRALADFLPPPSVDPDTMSGLDDVVADAINFKLLSQPLTKEQLAQLIQIPERRQ